MASNRHKRNRACRRGQTDAPEQTGYGRRRQERVAWRRDWWWRVRMVLAVALGCGLLVGLAAGARLGWRLAVLATWAVGGADLLRSW